MNNNYTIPRVYNGGGRYLNNTSPLNNLYSIGGNSYEYYGKK